MCVRLCVRLQARGRRCTCLCRLERVRARVGAHACALEGEGPRTCVRA